MKTEEKDVELGDIPYGIRFKCDGRTYVAVSFANTRTICYDVTDLKQVQISSYATVQIDELLYNDIKNYKERHGNRHFADYQRDNADVQIERQLELPFGELKKKKDTPETRALLKIIETFPFILDVADHKYDPEYANMALIKAMFNKLSVEQLVELFRNEEEGKNERNDK